MMNLKAGLAKVLQLFRATVIKNFKTKQMNLIRKISVIEEIAKKPGTLQIHKDLTFFTSYATKKLCKDFVVHSTELLNQFESPKNSGKYDIAFKLAKGELLAKLHEFDATNNYRLEGIEKKLIAIKFTDVIAICPNCVHMNSALIRFDQCLSGPFNLKLQGHINDEELNELVALPKQAWRDFIKLIFNKSDHAST